MPVIAVHSPSRELYVDAASGLAGDMFLAALLDVGVPQESVLDPLRAALPPFRLEVTVERRRGIRCRRLAVHAEEAAPPRRTLAEIDEILARAPLEPMTRERAHRVFATLAAAEAEVHGVERDQVTFHEVGAIDSLVDVIGSIVAASELQVARITCSSLPLGSGTVHTEHGLYPVPAPATLRLLAGLPTHPLEVGREVVTPTGAALARELADRFGPPPAGRIEQIGYGAGTRIARAAEPPNLLRVWTLTPQRPESGSALERVTVLETNIDHLAGEDAGHLVSVLLRAGALDVFLLPAIHKKSRPGLLVTALADPERAVAVEERLFLETGTLGIRRRTQERSVLRRESVGVEVRGERVAVKCAWLGDRLISAAPEYEDLRRLATRHEVPLRLLREEAKRAFGSRGAGGEP